MPQPSDFVRSYMLDPFPKCLASPDCFEEGNPDLDGLCEPCYRETHMAILQVEVIQLEKALKEKQRVLLQHQTRIALKRGRVRHLCTVCEEQQQHRSFLSNIDATEHVLLCHTNVGKAPSEKKGHRAPSGKSKPQKDVTTVEEYI